ncbi:MAG: hypothetical protein R3A10_16130 [Caldilineaceae bacterium]
MPAQTVCETIPAGPVVILNPQKSVTPTTVAPGGAVRYTVDVTNVGTATSGSPVVIRDVLPTGFTYAAAYAEPRQSTAGNDAERQRRRPGQSRHLHHPRALPRARRDSAPRVNGANQDAGTYCNRYVQPERREPARRLAGLRQRGNGRDRRRSVA